MSRKLVLALVAPLLGHAACGSDGGDTLDALDPIAAIQAVPDAADAAGSARFEMTITIDAPDGAVDLVSTGGWSGDQMRMEMDLGSALAGFGGGELPEGADEPMQVVVDAGTAYLRIPMLAALSGSDGWLIVTPEALGQVGELGLASGTSDPSQMLQALRGVSDDIEEVGEEDLRGEATTHYRATADLTKAIDAAPEAQRDRLQAQLEGFDVELDEVPFDVWVDEDGQARRVAFDFADMAGGLLGDASTATLTMDVFDYGQPVEVEVPDAAEATPIEDVLGAFGGLG
jgi:hypothetical protein